MSLSTSHNESRTTIRIKLGALELTLIATDAGDLEISVPRGLILSSKIILLDTDGVSRLSHIDEALSGSSGEYIYHPEEAVL
jgi:hypothetical protein